MVPVCAVALLACLIALAGADAAQQALERYVVVPSESEARYRVAETFLRDMRYNVAVGRTRQVEGEIQVNRRSPAASRAAVTVDLTTLQSDSPRRDNAIRERWLESSKFPKARFVSTEIRKAPASYREGQAVELEVVGDLTVRDVTRRVAWQVSVRLSGNELRAQATTTVRMTDFGFEPPHILGIVRAENEAKLELDLVARREGP